MKQAMDITNFIPKKVGHHGHTKYINFGSGNVSIIEVFTKNNIESDTLRELDTKLTNACHNWNKKYPENRIDDIPIGLIDYGFEPIELGIKKSLKILREKNIISEDEYKIATTGKEFETEYLIVVSSKCISETITYDDRKEWIETIYKIVGENVIPQHRH